MAMECRNRASFNPSCNSNLSRAKDFALTMSSLHTQLEMAQSHKTEDKANNKLAGNCCCWHRIAGTTTGTTKL
ncbi:hypothetical protein ACLKA6_014629 [Drosophila palustris]